MRGPQAASATIRLHFIPIGQAMSGPHTMGMAQAPSDATDCPFEAAVSGLQYVTPSQPQTGHIDPPTQMPQLVMG